MNKNNLLTFLTFVLLWSTSNLCAQDDYIVQDGESVFQVDLVENHPLSNASFILSQYKGDTIQYTPNEIEGYGLANGKEWKAFDVIINGQTQRYFFQKLYISWTYDLYYLRTREDISNYYLYLKSDSSLLTIPKNKEDYVPFLEDFTKRCPRAMVNASFARLKRNALIRFFKSYDTCYKGSLPRPRFAISSGLALNKYSPKVPLTLVGSPNYIFGAPDYEYTNGTFLSLIFDVPIASTNVSFNSGIILKTTTSSYTFTRSRFDELPSDYDLNMSNTWLNVPFNFRYTFYVPAFKPYLQTGFTYTKVLKNEVELIRYDFITGDIADIDNTPAISERQVGFSGAIGAIFKYDSKFSFFGEIKYAELYSDKQRTGKLNVKEIYFTIGLIY